MYGWVSGGGIWVGISHLECLNTKDFCGCFQIFGTLIYLFRWVSGGVIELAGLISNVWLIGLCGLLHFVVLVAVNWMGSCGVIDLVGLISNVWGGCIFGYLIQLIASPEVQQRDVNGDGSKLSPARESVNQPPWLWQGTSFLTKLGGESLTICFLL
jgi:hypothetical protein